MGGTSPHLAQSDLEELGLVAVLVVAGLGDH